MKYSEDLTAEKVTHYKLDVYDGRWVYKGTHQSIARELISQLDVNTVDIWALAATVHEVEIGDILTETE